MKRIVGSAICLAATFVLAIAHGDDSKGADAPFERPPGVRESDWIRLTDALGFVIEPGREAYRGLERWWPGGGSVRGYFVVRRGDEWQRVDLTTHPRFERASPR